MDIVSYLQERKELVNKALDAYLQGREDLPPRLLEAMRYSVFAGGKRIRPILALAAGEAVGGDIEAIMPAACALEFIHTASLIHDDLPALDDDDYRRGKPANHRVFGEAIAIVAADALMIYAFELMSSVYSNGLLPAEVALQVMREVAAAAGPTGIMAGEVTDLLSSGESADPALLRFIHEHKTAAMIIAPVRVGGIVAGANEEQLAALTDYGRHLGLGFQIVDDLLDATGDRHSLGKTAGKDQRQKKLTYVALYGVEEARKLAVQAIRRAQDALLPLGERAEPLRLLGDFVLYRVS